MTSPQLQLQHMLSKLLLTYSQQAFGKGFIWLSRFGTHHGAFEQCEYEEKDLLFQPIGIDISYKKLNNIEYVSGDMIIELLGGTLNIDCGLLQYGFELNNWFVLDESRFYWPLFCYVK